MTVETPRHLDLCVNHKQEWKHSHFTEHNCDYCKALATIKSLTMRLEWLNDPRSGNTEAPWIKQGQKILKANGVTT